MNTRELELALAAADPVGRTGSTGSTSRRWKPSCSPTSTASRPALPGRRAPTPRRAAPPAAARARPRRRGARRHRSLPSSSSPAAAPSAPPAPTAPTSSASPNRRRCCCSKGRAGGSRTSTRTSGAKASKGRWNSSPASRSPTNRSRRHRQREDRQPSRGCSRPRCASAGSSSPGATAASRTRSRCRAQPHPHGRAGRAAGPRHHRLVDTRAEFFVNQGGPGNRADDRASGPKAATCSN